jgi:hypothetical protein
MQRSTEPDLILIGFDDGDVVWGERLEPDRAILRSIPSPGGGFRWLDEIVVVPEPVTEVELSGGSYQVFAAHGRAEGSGIPTVVVTVGSADPNGAARLVELLSERGWRVEDWTEEVGMVCASCIEAPADAAHRHDPTTTLDVRTIAVAGRPAEVAAVLRRWQGEQPGRRRSISMDETT